LLVAKETVESVERAVWTAAGAVETIRHANVVQTVRSWWSLKA
jgi:tRNA C32,U32 (ribose-2'-O)-methylase TrmJ